MIYILIFRKLKRIDNVLPELLNRIRENEESLLNKRRQESELQEKITAKQSDVDAARNEASSANSNNNALNALMNEKKNERIRGIYGRLGDLGGIDPQYDVAISTCCPQLDHVVVDTVETAQECIEFVRRENLGRVNFIALDKQNNHWDRIRNVPRT